MAIAYAALVSGTADAQARRPVTRHLDFSLTGDVVYDDNVSRSSRALADLRGLKQADTRFTPGVKVDGLIPFGRQSLSIIGSAGYDFYARNSRLNRERIALDTVLALRFGRCDGTINGSYARRQSQLDDLILIVDPSLINDPSRFRRGLVRNTEEIKTIGASASCGAAVGLRPTASIQHTWVDNSQAIRRFSDYYSTSYSAGIAYARPRFGELTVFGRYDTTTFPNRANLPGFGGQKDGYEVKGGGVRFERELGSRLLGLAELSYSSVNPKRDGVPGFSGLTWRLNLTADVSSRLQLIAQASRAVEPSNRVDANYSISRIYGLNGTYTLSPRLTLEASALQRQRDYRGAGILFLPIIGEPLLMDKSRTYSAGLRYRASERLGFTLSGAHETRNANGTFYDYTSNRVLAGVAWRI